MINIGLWMYHMNEINDVDEMTKLHNMDEM
jgi:hypothetical protein